MANGVPETDVFKAADAVLARGERPTVERVRSELGRGSPARVGQLLEQWWERLAQRLKGHALLPELPGEAAQAFTEIWRVALVHAATAAETALSEQQNTLFAAQTSLTQERKLWEVALTETRAELAEYTSKLGQVELQLAERQSLIDQLNAEVADVRHQRVHVQGQLAHRQAELDTLRAEYAAAHAHIRAVEDRAHRQVDQLRQELKGLRQQREMELRDRDKQLTQLASRERDLLDSLRVTEQAAAHHSGRIAALEATLTNWQREQTVTARTARKESRKGAAPSASSGRSRKKN